MMANETWRATTAKCPYYARSNARTITCSPTGGDNDEVRRRLKSNEDCAEWFKSFCARWYFKCVCYKIIEQFLEEKP